VIAVPGSLPSPIRLVIFDCDGVLIDSEPLAMRVLLRALATAGLDVTAESGFRNFLGRSFSTISQSLEDLHGLRLDAAAVATMREDLFATYRAELKPMAGLLETLPQLGVAFCVASSSEMRRIETSLEITGLTERFGPRIFSAAMVGRGKPAPDLFLHTARENGRDTIGMPGGGRQSGGDHRGQEGRHARLRLYRRLAHRTCRPGRGD
jgi:beta-phosphoglucomutase-like phosphatase (HAD superfamily)